MGAIFFRSGMAGSMLGAIDACFTRVRGRLAYISVVASTLFAAASGSSIANTGMMGSLMVPEMLKRGYKRSLVMGPILGAGGLAVIIPPSSLTVFLGSLARIDVGALLIAGIVPGVLLALSYVLWIAIQIARDPTAAPGNEEVRSLPLAQRLLGLARESVPMGVIIFSVVGTMVFGLATPTESAAFGCLATGILSLRRRSLRELLRLLYRSLDDTLRVTSMTFILIITATSFSQLLAYTGATGALIESTTRLITTRSRCCW